MRRRWKILLLAACGLIAVVAVCFFCLRENEPSYNGRTLSEWLERAPGDRAAILAVRQIGTNAVPLLLKWGTKENTPVFRTIRNFAEKLPPSMGGTFISDRFYRASSEWYTVLAIRGFRVLGRDALPCLRAFSANPDPRLRDCASEMAEFITELHPDL